MCAGLFCCHLMCRWIAKAAANAQELNSAKNPKKQTEHLFQLHSTLLTSLQRCSESLWSTNVYDTIAFFQLQLSLKNHPKTVIVKNIAIVLRSTPCLHHQWTPCQRFYFTCRQKINKSSNIEQNRLHYKSVKVLQLRYFSSDCQGSGTLYASTSRESFAPFRTND